eukprot:213431_1
MGCCLDVQRPDEDGRPVAAGDDFSFGLPPMTRADLEKKREEFWETRIDGEPETWEGLHRWVDTTDEGAKKLIIKELCLTQPEIDKDEGMSCYSNNRGNKYEIPQFILSNPKNLLPDEVDQSDVDPDDKNSSPLTFKIRLSSGTDIEVTLNTSSRISDVKSHIASSQSVEASNIRIVFKGKLLKDNVKLAKSGIVDGIIVQAMIKST